MEVLKNFEAKQKVKLEGKPNAYAQLMGRSALGEFLRYLRNAKFDINCLTQAIHDRMMQLKGKFDILEKYIKICYIMKMCPIDF